MFFHLQGGEISESGSVDELSTGHFHMPYDMVREGTFSEIVFVTATMVGLDLGYGAGGGRGEGKGGKGGRGWGGGDVACS